MISIIIDADAWLIAQPEPVYAASLMIPSTRLSMYLYTRKEDLDAFLEVLKTVRSVMGFTD
ncbi:Cysteine desulfurase [human gut metagenome]|uniref:Cysteine desulfurase n=1 Tax=human gut metagenome TaxID=408170 RepID=W1XEX1_9ZZZZ